MKRISLSFNKVMIILLMISCMRVTSNEKYVRGSKGWGFFAEFLWAINHLHYCKTHAKTPVIYWGPSFAYFSSQGYNGSTNCWEYYFEPVSSAVYVQGDRLEECLFYSNDNNFSSLWEYQQYIFNFNLLNKDEITLVKLSNYVEAANNVYPVWQHLYSKKFRKYVKETIIDYFIVIKPYIAKIIENYYIKEFEGKRTIGIHLRGKFLWNESPYVETDFIMEYANKFADGNTQFFVATDQKHLLDAAKVKLKGKVLYYESQRFNHSTAPVAGQAKLHPILGENVLIETILLSKCDHLIHGISNVSTAALYFNPEMTHTLLY